MFIFKLYRKLPPEAQFVCLHINLWVFVFSLESSNKISRLMSACGYSYDILILIHNHSVQLGILTSSSNQLIRWSTLNIRGIGLPFLRFLNERKNTRSQNKKMRTLCLLKFTVFCVLRLLFLLSLPFPSLGSHLPEGGWGNHASAALHFAVKKQDAL